MAKEVLEMPFPIDEDKDKDVFIWETSPFGFFIFSNGYEIICHWFPVKS